MSALRQKRSFVSGAHFGERGPKKMTQVAKSLEKLENRWSAPAGTKNTSPGPNSSVLVSHVNRPDPLTIT
jgi:hypothetical protein